MSDLGDVYGATIGLEYNKSDLNLVFTHISKRFRDTSITDTIIDKNILESGVNYPVFSSYDYFFTDIMYDSVQNYYLEIFTKDKTYQKDVYDIVSWSEGILIVEDKDLQ